MQPRPALMFTPSCTVSKLFFSLYSTIFLSASANTVISLGQGSAGTVKGADTTIISSLVFKAGTFILTPNATPFTLNCTVKGSFTGEPSFLIFAEKFTSEPCDKLELDTIIPLAIISGSIT